MLTLSARFKISPEEFQSVELKYWRILFERGASDAR